MGPKVIIIGSGIGGLCSGIRLAKEGFQVEIFEKHRKAGGVAQTLHSSFEGFPFDMAASITIDPQSYEKIFRDVGLAPEDYFTFMDLDVLYKVFYENGDTYHLCYDLSKQIGQFEKQFKESLKDYRAFVQKFYKKYEFVDKEFFSKSFFNLKSMLNKNTIKSFIGLKPFSTVDISLSRSFSNEHLKNLLMFQSFYMGTSPYKLINTYATVPALSQHKGIKHIKGGMGAYVDGLVKAFEGLGGWIHYGKPIDEILIKDNVAYGVSCDGHFFSADLIISNADVPYTLSRLIKNEVVKNRYNPMYCSNFKMSCSTFILRLVLNGKLSQFNVHNLYLNDAFKMEIEKVFSGRLPYNPPLYMYYPSSIDDTFVKGNQTCMNIMVRVPNLAYGNILWDDISINRMRKICLKTLEKISGITNFPELILHEEVLTPETLESDFNCYMGSGFGIGHDKFQSIAFRPQCRIPSLHNLYFTGASVHPGAGVNLVMKSAELVVQDINS